VKKEKKKKKNTHTHYTKKNKNILRDTNTESYYNSSTNTIHNTDKF